MSALLTFLGGSAFRMVWGEVSAFIKNRQEHAQELEMIKIQADIEAAKHERLQEALKVQHSMGIQTIQVQAEADLSRIDAEGFYKAVESSNNPSGVLWVDGWNAAIRPAAATIVILLWVLALNRAGFVMSDFDKELVCVILGFFFANRALAFRGK
jgi:hypothetical protein